jgi:hypothetical protein
MYDECFEKFVLVLYNNFVWLNLFYALYISAHLCGLVVKVPGYRSRGPGFDSQHYQIFWEVVGLEWGPPCFLSIIEELLGRYSSGPGLEIREYGHRDPLLWPLGTLYSRKLTSTMLTSGGRLVGLVLPQTKATEFCDIPTVD